MERCKFASLVTINVGDLVRGYISFRASLLFHDISSSNKIANVAIIAVTVNGVFLGIVNHAKTYENILDYINRLHGSRGCY